MIILTGARSQLSLEMLGGRIHSLTLNSIRLLGTFTRIDGKIGNSHICTPNFSTEGVQKYALPQHGSAREKQWSVEKQSNNVCTISCIVPPDGFYPSTLVLEQRFALMNNSFEHTLTVTNQGMINAPVNAGFHYYWDTPKGWNQVTINKKNISKHIAKDTNIPAHPKNIIMIPDKPAITLETGSTFSILRLWTGRKIEKNQTVFDTAYACIEPVYKNSRYFDSPQSMLRPKEAIIVTLKISI